jgi:phage FluMu gp28-like protein
MGDRVAGVDIGQRRDYTAVVVLDAGGVIRAAHRLQLGQDWARIVAGVAALVRDCDPVVVDDTGVGAPVAEALAALVPVVPFTFTKQSKLELIGHLAAMIGERRLRVAADATGADALREELSRFVAMPTRTGLALTGKGAGGHDDLVMATALAVCAALLRERRKGIMNSDERVRG